MWCEVQQPLGEGLPRVMAVALFALTIWQLIERTVGRDDPNQGSRVPPVQLGGPPSACRHLSHDSMTQRGANLSRIQAPPARDARGCPDSRAAQFLRAAKQHSHGTPWAARGQRADPWSP